MKVLVIGGGIGGFATALLPRLGTGDRPALRVEHHLAQQRGDRDDPDPVAGRRNEWQAADKIVYSTTLPPVVIGGGNPLLPDRLRLDLRLMDERRFHSGVVYVRYRVSG